MSEQVDPKEQWYAILTHMVEEHRLDHPNDARDDVEIITDLMEYFVKSGLIRKEDGKYIIPELTNDA